MGQADLHIHTTYSYDGTASVAATLEHVKQNTKLSVIAITDHDEIAGALEAVRLAPRYGIEVIPGVEVTTDKGHLLALWVREPIPPNRSLIETVEHVASLGGLCIAPHPAGFWSGSLSDYVLSAALANPVVKRTLVGLEEYNASLLALADNNKARQLNRRLGLAPVASSDAHMLWMIGRAYTQFPGYSAADLRRSLLNDTTRMAIEERPWTFYPSYLKRQMLRAGGWAQDAQPTPGSTIALAHMSSAQPLTYARQMMLAK